MTRLHMRHMAVFAALLFAAAAVNSAAEASMVKGTLATSAGDSVTDEDLAKWIKDAVGDQASDPKVLVVFTQCYGGDAVDNFSGADNTAVTSATSPGEEAVYGGYDDDAAGALAPGAGDTGQDVHDAGTSGKDSSETPSTGGGLAPNDFPLDEPSGGTDVESRHVIVYAGQPDNSPGRDNDQRDTIKGNFAGQPNTSVTTVGGSGGGGWDKKGTAKDLKKAIDDAGTAINGATNPDKEQLILFVTDHGDLKKEEPVLTPVPTSTCTPVTGFDTWATGEILLSDLDFTYSDPANLPGFAISVSGFSHAFDPDAYVPFFGPGQWELRLQDPTNLAGPPIVLSDYVELYREFDDDFINPLDGEGVTLLFPMDEVLYSLYFDTTVDVQICNNSGATYDVDAFWQDSGLVQKTPEPATLVLLLAGALPLLRRRAA